MKKKTKKISQAISNLLRVLRNEAGKDEKQVAAIANIESQLRTLPAITMNIKNFGSELAERVFKELESTQPLNRPDRRLPAIHLTSKACTYQDMASDWLAYWCDRLHSARLCHRKIWELCYVSQAIAQSVDFAQKSRGLVFGCGEEPLPSLFASMGADIVATDLSPEKVKGSGWDTTGQYASSLDKIYKSQFLPREIFDKRVTHEYVDMNDIPARYDLSFDFCWSVCALEHLGSIENGLNFIENSLRVLKPGGVAVHTTEFSFSNTAARLESGWVVLYRREHLEALCLRLKAQGFAVAPLDFNVGNTPLDRFIDIPPYADINTDFFQNPSDYRDHSCHLKLIVENIPTTCFGIIIKKPNR